MFKRYQNSSYLTIVECSIGCKQLIKPKERHKHEDECLAKIVYCPAKDIMCNWTGPRANVATHSAECLYQRLRPAHAFVTFCNKQEKKIEELENRIAILEREKIYRSIAE